MSREKSQRDSGQYRRKNRGHSSGALLLEFVISSLLLATAIVAIASLMLTLSLQTKGTKLHKDSALLAKDLRDELSNYVADKRELLENTPSDAYWHLPGDACGTGCSKNCWALEACTHDITLWLPPEFRSDYEVKKAVYEVTDVKKNGAVLKNIKIEIETNDKPAETK